MPYSFRNALLAIASASIFFLAGCGETEAIPECMDLDDSDMCSLCCEEEGYVGHSYSDFSDPPCECRVAGD